MHLIMQRQNDRLKKLPGWTPHAGTNINAAMDPNDLKEANNAIILALKYATQASEKEQGLINAISKRYPKDTVDDLSLYHNDYAKAMEILNKKYPDDDNIAILYAEAAIDKYPWNYWLKDGTPQPWTMSIITTIEEVLSRSPKHIGANHLYIHITEASKNPGKAMASADFLRDALPAAGHVVHMPSHTYIRTGRYHDGVIANEKATLADSSYITQCNAQGIYPIAYYPHNDHFMSACAFFSGESKKSISGAYATSRHTRHVYMRETGFGTLQHYSVVPLYVLVRFGNWDEILNYPKPEADLIYPNAVYHYARGMAFLGKKEKMNAELELKKLIDLSLNNSIKSITIWDINSCYELVQIANYVLSGELAAANKEYTLAIKNINKALLIEDALAYNEPPDWFFSIRHHLGAVLLDAGRYADAEKVYLEDLEKYPENGWALIGLHQALLKQNKSDDADHVKKRFDAAWKFADIKIQSSRIL